MAWRIAAHGRAVPPRGDHVLTPIHAKSSRSGSSGQATESRAAHARRRPCRNHRTAPEPADPRTGSAATEQRTAVAPAAMSSTRAGLKSTRQRAGAHLSVGRDDVGGGRSDGRDRRRRRSRRRVEPARCRLRSYQKAVPREAGLRCVPGRETLVSRQEKLEPHSCQRQQRCLPGERVHHAAGTATDHIGPARLGGRGHRRARSCSSLRCFSCGLSRPRNRRRFATAARVRPAPSPSSCWCWRSASPRSGASSRWAAKDALSIHMQRVLDQADDVALSQLRQASVEATSPAAGQPGASSTKTSPTRETRGAFSGLRGEGSVVATLRNMSQMFGNLSRTVKASTRRSGRSTDRYKQLTAEGAQGGGRDEAADVSESDKIRRNNLAFSRILARSTRSSRGMEKRRPPPTSRRETRTSAR